MAKTGAVYIQIPCLPEIYLSKLENDFVALLFNTFDRELFQNKLIFPCLNDEFNFLQDKGITIKLPDKEIRLFFETSLCIGKIWVSIQF